MPAAGASSEQKSRLTDLKLQMPTLGNQNFIEWNEELTNVQYYGSWKEEIIDINQTDPNPWDGNEDGNAKDKRDRRDAFALIRLTTSTEYKHLLSGSRPGDAKDLYQRLFNRFVV